MSTLSHFRMSYIQFSGCPLLGEYVMVPPMKTKVRVHPTVELADHRRVEEVGWTIRVFATCTLGSGQYGGASVEQGQWLVAQKAKKPVH